MLEREGYQVLTASNGIVGLRTVKDENPDLLGEIERAVRDELGLDLPASVTPATEEPIEAAQSP